ncbi:MAG: hypothetical protein HYX23_00510 [Candidatus Zambryskibacteria bacterium]|nr:hypothetical protein [Candidatus Zambryskibacteria bacterium]
MDNELEKKLGDKLVIFNQLHKFIMSLNPKINFRLSTVYVRYMLKDDIVTVVYFRGKFVSDCKLNVGFAFKEKPKGLGFRDAKYMSYPNINYSIRLKTDKDVTKNLSKQLGKYLF